MTKLGRLTPRVAQKKLVTHPPTETSNADVDIGTLGNIGSPLKSESPKNLQYLKEKSEKLKSSIQKENAQRFTKKSGKIISGQECGQRFNEKCLGMIAELQSNIDQTLMRKEAQKEEHKRMYPFAKETFVSKKRRVKENKAKARKRRRKRAEKNCERVFSAISHSSSYREVRGGYSLIRA